MSQYRIYFTQVVSGSVEVEADDLAQAQDLAWDELPSGFCAQCSGWGQDWAIDEGEWQLDESLHTVDGDTVEVVK